MDDDIVPVPGFVASHAAAQTTSETVVIGYLPPVLGTQVGFFRVVLRRWWEDMFSRMRQPGHRFHAFDLLSGNVSMPATLFRRVGGFDERFRCHEDYELGVRLIEAGARFAFSGDASGAHHEATDLRRALCRKFDEGRADVALGQKHPEMIPELPLQRALLWRSRRMRISMRLAFLNPKATGLVMLAGIAGLTVLERLRARRQWRRLLDDLLVYWYWRGVADALGSAEAVARFADHVSHGTDSQMESTVDLRTGLPAAETRLQDDCRSTVRLTYGVRPVGRVLPRAGAEPLRGRHLRPILEGPLAAPLLDAMACDGAIPAFLSAERLRALCRAQPLYRIHGVEPL
jgi:hypothetical protein